MGQKLLWLGSYESDEHFNKSKSKTIGTASGYTSQKGLVKGMDALLNEDDIMDTLGVCVYAPYPKCPDKKIQPTLWNRTKNSQDLLVGYYNYKYVNYISRYFSLLKETKKWVKNQDKSNNFTVFVYAPSVEKLKGALLAKKRLGAKVYVIVPDVPKFVNKQANFIIRSAKNIAEKIMKNLLKDVDGFILYSKHMAKYYGLASGQWVTVEGVFDPEEADFFVKSEEKQKSDTIKIMYSGALHPGRGIPQLLDAIDNMRDKKYELWITGEGVSDDLIHERAEKDERIHHFGFLQTRQEVLDLQNQADILIHTREVDAESASYCFPSKLFEYMVSEKPIVSVKIPGIPDEYFDYLIPIEQLTAEGLKEAIGKIANMDSEELEKRTKGARKFVLENKTSKIQASKILDFADVKHK